MYTTLCAKDRLSLKFISIWNLESHNFIEANMATTSSYHIIDAFDADAQAILEVTNDAFMADAFFKKAEYHLRFDIDTVHKMMQSPNSVFLIAKNIDQDEVLGSMYLHLDISDSKVSLAEIQMITTQLLTIYSWTR